MAENNALPANMDLEAILRTLAGLPKPEGQQLSQPESLNFGTFAQSSATEQNVLHQIADPRLAGRPAPSKLQAPPQPQSRSSTPLIDPATIIDWKQGLRCVSKIAAQNPDFAASIRKVLRTNPCCL